MQGYLGNLNVRSEDVAIKLIEVFRAEIQTLKEKKMWSDADKKNFRRMREAVKIVSACRK